MKTANGSAPDTSLERLARMMIERLGGEWRQGGGMCRCPTHDDRTPSLSVRPGERRLLFHCFAGCDARDVIRALAPFRLHVPELPARADETPKTFAECDRRNRGAAARLWAAARPIASSPVEAYLRGRGLTLQALDLRYHPRTPYGRASQAIFCPAMLAAVRDESGLVALHRTFVDRRSARLAGLTIPKRALGRLRQGAVRLAPPRDGILGLAEGIESAIAATQLTETPCWATLGTERFARVALPPSITHLILFLDNDPGGRRAERLARKAHGGTDIEIEARYPIVSGADWNDAVLGPVAS